MKITEVKPLENYKLFLQFDNGESGVVDLSDLVGRGVLEAWNKDGAFKQVNITALGALEWPGEIDLCPDALYLRLTGKHLKEIFPALRETVTHA